MRARRPRRPRAEADRLMHRAFATVSTYALSGNRGFALSGVAWLHPAGPAEHVGWRDIAVARVVVPHVVTYNLRCDIATIKEMPRAYR